MIKYVNLHLSEIYFKEVRNGSYAFQEKQSNIRMLHKFENMMEDLQRKTILKNFNVFHDALLISCCLCGLKLRMNPNQESRYFVK
jgi:hypothetical protein